MKPAATERRATKTAITRDILGKAVKREEVEEGRLSRGGGE